MKRIAEMKQMRTFVDENKRSFFLAIPLLPLIHFQQTNLRIKQRYIYYVRVYINIRHHIPPELRFLMRHLQLCFPLLFPLKYLSSYIRIAKTETPYNLAPSS